MKAIGSRTKKRALIGVLVAGCIALWAVYYINVCAYTTTGYMAIVGVSMENNTNYIYVNPNWAFDPVAVSCPKELELDDLVVDEDFLYSMSFRSSTLHPHRGTLLAIDVDDTVDNR